MRMWWPAAPAVTATAALNRNRNQRTGLEESSDFTGIPFVLACGWAWPGQMAAWAVVLSPRLVISAMAAPASATAAPTRKALCIPAVNVAWLIWVITPATCAGVLWVTGATPTETALLTWAYWAAVSAGRCAACQLAGSRLSILADMM